VLGTGDIGSAVATALAALGDDVIGVSRSGARSVPAFRAVHRADALPGLVGDAQWLIVTLPDTPATRGLVSHDLLARCRGAVLLNAGRGAVVDEDAIPGALERGWLRGAALDVFRVEPLPASSPLWQDPRVMISPHISGLTTIEGAADGFLECLVELEAGRLPRWAVDRSRGY
jgi:phosphoglycerate dehydrogenase-like enzyme